MKKIAYLFIAFLAIGFSVKAQDKDSLQQYIGKFTFPEGNIVSYVTVTLEAGKLNFSSDKGTGTLEKIAADSFNIPEYQGTAKYVRSADSKITGVVIDVMGYHLEGTKEIPAIALLMDRQRYLKLETNQLAVR
ncbi:MAG: hypothetical protein K2Q21_14080 [Chitinophagaceae bacterium]|nr:hypothetical protein [Chitinophagaceae bacterium]